MGGRRRAHSFLSVSQFWEQHPASWRPLGVIPSCAALESHGQLSQSLPRGWGSLHRGLRFPSVRPSSKLLNFSSCSFSLLPEC